MDGHRVRRWATSTLLVAGAGCGVVKPPEQAAPTTLAPIATSIPVVVTTVPVTEAPAPLIYAFPFVGKEVSYQQDHHDYPATDVFGCGATVVAPVWGDITEIRTDDIWDPNVDNPGTRGGRYVTMVGGDDVRYYFAHLESVAVAVGDKVDAGAPLGVMGQTGNARNSGCHTHFGISRQCPQTEWGLRRGEVWPWKYLDGWRAGDSALSPVLEIYALGIESPGACEFSANSPDSADA